MELVFPALEGRFSTTGPPGKSTTWFSESLLLQHENFISIIAGSPKGEGNCAVATWLSAKHGGPFTTSLWFHDFLLFLPITSFAWKFLIPSFHLAEILVIYKTLLIYIIPLKISLTFDAHMGLTFIESTLLRINKVSIKISWILHMLLIQTAHKFQKNMEVITLYSC